MTNFKQVLKVGWRQQWRIVASSTLFILAVVALTWIAMFFMSTRDGLMIAMGGALLTAGVLLVPIIIIRLGNNTRRHLHANNFRLLPIENWKFYGAEILNVAFSILVVFLIQIVLLGIVGTFMYAHYGSPQFNWSANNWNVLVLVILGLIFMIIAASISFILLWHTADIASAFLIDLIPGGLRKLITFVVYVAIFWSVNVVADKIYSLFADMNKVFELSSATNLWTYNIYQVALCALLFVLNAWLLKFLETNR
ncbi:hypothetical protein HU830_03360 [Lactobacillus sp. DCY120]|uniref:Uncharacterized protein n=1 Tax=Bombilactobacillus apium TaxID=2675299 RepID=A0A850R6P7_9LACO|nr:hypothetical protein [Bombilactobacillus apium]NVY96215.1 hypothetical protein [Bombilactobacillus apium]